MDWIDSILGRYKEVGLVGTLILIAAKWGDKIFVWVLERLNIKINRAQSREDTLEKDVRDLKTTVAAQEKRLTRVEGAYDFMHDVVHKAADGIDEELKAKQWISPAITFFVGQLRTIQALEEILKD